MRRFILLFSIAFVSLVLVQGGAGLAKQANRDRNGAFDFGAISNDAETRHTFLIPNDRDAKLYLITAESSCAGVQILSYPQEIPSHRKGELTMRWLPGEPGEKVCKVVVETDDPANRNLSFEVRANFKPVPAEVQGELWDKGELRGGGKIPGEWITRRLKKRDPTLVVSVESVVKELKAKPEAILVDVRPRSEFEKLRIPGSMNVDLFAVRTKPFLKAKPIVLINEGYRYGQLEDEARLLRDAGFMVAILDGGLAAWRQKSGPLEGDAFAQKDLNKIPPQIFYQERVYDNWVVIDATTLNKHMAANLLPERVPLASLNGPEQFVAQLEAIVARHKARPSLFFLVLDDHGGGYEGMEKLLAEVGISRVFFLQGGIEGYRSFLEQQASLLQPAEQPKKIDATMRYLPLKRRSLILAGLCAVVALAALLLAKYLPQGVAKGSRMSDAPRVTMRHIQYRFSLQNGSNQVLDKAEFWTYGPVKMTAAQRCERLDANYPYELIVDDLGNQVLHFTFQNLPPFSTKLIHIQADVELVSAPRTIQAADRNDFLKAENRIESDSPEVLGLAKKLKARNTLDTAQNIFRWVSENIRYAGFHAADRGALYALRHRQGDCTEFMSLFVALCRANDIPARGIGGYVCPGDTILKAGDYHNWAEFYGDGTWRLADPQKRAFRERGPTNTLP